MNSKKKGNVWENKLANWLHSHGIKAWKDGASGGGNREKGDVGNNVDLTIESKAAKTICLPEWWKQVAHSADMHHNRPVLFIHRDGMPDMEWLVVMTSGDWIDIFKRSLGEKEIVEVLAEDSREKKWAMENLKAAANRALKFL